MELRRQRKSSYAKAFWSKAAIKDNDECWEWQHAIQSKGYGAVGIGNGKVALAHRVAYQLAKGEISPGLCVLHKCDNRKCINPNHLFLGTNRDNIDDMVKKGRQLSGERHPKAKLNIEKVKSIRALYSTGNYSYADLAKEFGIVPSYAKDVIKGDYWKLPLAA